MYGVITVLHSYYLYKLLYYKCLIYDKIDRAKTKRKLRLSMSEKKHKKARVAIYTAKMDGNCRPGDGEVF